MYNDNKLFQGLIQPLRTDLQPGYVIWFTGVSGSGKTTLSTKLADELKGRLRIQLLDGDQVRTFFQDSLGYSRADRIANVKRIAFAAKLLADHGVTVLVANIAPYYEVRDFIRLQIPRYMQVFLDVALETAARRDVKGLYARHLEGSESNPMIGVDDVYERPRKPDLIIHTDLLSIEDSLREIVGLLIFKGIVDA